MTLVVVQNLKWSFCRLFTCSAFWSYLGINILVVEAADIDFHQCCNVWYVQYAMSDEFYNERSVLYRIWYLYPSFVVFRMRMYIGMRLSECVFTMSGLGAYPSVTEPKPAQGPSTELSALTRM